MQIHCDWTAGVLRLLPKGGTYGDPYIWSASVVRTGDTIIIMGVASMPENPHVVRSVLREWCREQGIKTVRWERFEHGAKRVEEHAV